MDTASASAHAPVPEPVHVGELGSLARQANLQRMERAIAAQQARTTLQEAAAREARVPGAARQQAGSQRPAADPRARLAAQRQTRPFEVTDLFPHQRVPADRRAPAADSPDGQVRQELRDVLGELRSLRGEISSLSRLVGKPVTQSPAFKGVLQQPDRLSSDEQLSQWRETEVRLEARAGAAAERREERQGSVESILRENEIQRIERRQRELLIALERAEKHLSQAPERLPPGLRDRIIGEIYRAKYSIALFGGTYGGGPATGMAFDGTI